MKPFQYVIIVSWVIILFDLMLAALNIVRYVAH